ncbi:LamG-like jellyroll fold domain-containing protein [Pedobacter sp. JY14-1]|uniref:LamG-like jellyroll fold domain-containing protein n=1 Tax=Pedobacter sp. JY14-1 TaxID=3034151 RepID=UPI0023E2D926|nr:LamG-like jellyroll fold domain-containing protein [Pedobacter sp. JY14-1]
MLKKNHILFLFMVFQLLIIQGCSKKDPEFNIVELKLEQTGISLTPDNSLNVTIETGNGDYTVVSSNDQVAQANVSGNVITIKATTREDRANAVIVVTDKMFKRATIDVSVTKLLELTLNSNELVLEAGVPGKNEATISVKTGNFGYKTKLLDNAADIVHIDAAKLETYGKFTVKALKAGTAKIKVSDVKGKDAILIISVTSPAGVVTDKSSVKLAAVQGTGQVTITGGNGGYRAIVANPLVAKAVVNGNIVTIKGKINGATTVDIIDNKDQKTTVNVIVEGPAYAMNFSDQYFGYANFTDIGIVDQSVKRLKKVTFEMTCKIDGYRGLQTFMGLEGKLIIRGKNDDYKDTHPIQIAGLGDKIMLESTTSFKLNEWMNITLVVDCDQQDIREKYKLYINGIQDVLVIARQDETHTTVDLTSSADGNRFEIGRAFGQDFRAMRGTVSEARVWTVARTAQQIKDNMCGLSGQNNNGLLARWDFSAGTETGYIQDSNGGKYETNLILANAKSGNNYDQVKVPKLVFVSKGCPD